MRNNGNKFKNTEDKKVQKLILILNNCKEIKKLAANAKASRLRKLPKVRAWVILIFLLQFSGALLVTLAIYICYSVHRWSSQLG